MGPLEISCVRIGRHVIRLVVPLLAVEVGAIVVGAILPAEALIRYPEWISLPLTVKCSSLMKHFECLLISAKNCCATSLVSKRSQFFENTTWFHTSSSSPDRRTIGTTTAPHGPSKTPAVTALGAHTQSRSRDAQKPSISSNAALSEASSKSVSLRISRDGWSRRACWNNGT